MSVITYQELTLNRGVVSEIRLDKEGRRTYLRFRLQSHNDLFYQVYRGKFFDVNLNKLQKLDTISFYTADEKFSPPPLINKSNQRGFYYYPIFNINNQKSILDIFLYEYTRTSISNTIMLIAIISCIVCLFPILMITKWPNKILILIIELSFIWLMV
ncbi:hypothetical protein [Pedobacter alluvionis]|nr:hypothetical protein [Pedobacter alluvionis]